MIIDVSNWFRIVNFSIASVMASTAYAYAQVAIHPGPTDSATNQIWLPTVLGFGGPLLKDMAVVVVMAYFIVRGAKFVLEVLDGNYTWQNRTFLIAVFGAFSVYGTVSGPIYQGSVVSIRDLGPTIAGLIGGPAIGIGAAIIGAAHRLLIYPLTQPVLPALDTSIPGAIVTLLSGTLAGLMFHLRKGKFIGVFWATVFMAFIVLLHNGLSVVLLNYHPKAIEKASYFVFPMLAANCIGMAIFAMMIAHVIKERQMQAERDSFLKAKERVEGELMVARDIQLSMVPGMSSPVRDRSEFDLFATMKPAKEVGGDLYDFFLVDENHLFIAIGDVSDKGAPAALFMAVAKTLLKGLATVDQPLDRLLTRVNVAMAEENQLMQFVTLFAAVIDLRTGVMSYSNAGHNPPVICRCGGEADWLKVPLGFMLGVEPKACYSTLETTLLPGDTLVTYTDGVTEATNLEDMFYGNDRLLTIAKKCQGDSAEAMVKSLEADVSEHVAGAPQSDDITILIVKYLCPSMSERNERRQP